MNFNYDAVNQITNQDFATSTRTLLDDCQSIEKKYNSGDLRSCCKDARAINEVILRYMYERLIGYCRKPLMAGTILKDPKFTSKVTDINLLMAAEDVQRIGSQYVHDDPYPNESEEQFKVRIRAAAERLSINTETILERLSVVLERAIAFINSNISGIRGKLNIRFKHRINPKTSIEECILEADLSDVVDYKDYTYVWKIQGQNAPYCEKSRIISLNQPWMKDKVIILEAINKVTKQTLSDRYGPIKEEELTLRNTKSRNSSKPVNTESKSEDDAALRGRLYIEKADDFNGAGVKLQAILTEADYKLEDDDISVVWGVIGDDGNFIRITGETARKNTSFRCQLKKGSLGKSYRCIVSRSGYEQTLEADYRKLTSDDFAISGDVEIKVDPVERVLKAVVRNPNYNGQPVYKWLRNGAVVEGFNDRTIPISADDIEAVYMCEIALPDQFTGNRTSDKYTVKIEDIQKTEVTLSDLAGESEEHEDITKSVEEPKHSIGTVELEKEGKANEIKNRKPIFSHRRIQQKKFYLRKVGSLVNGVSLESILNILISIIVILCFAEIEWNVFGVKTRPWFSWFAYFSCLYPLFRELEFFGVELMFAPYGLTVIRHISLGIIVLLAVTGGVLTNFNVSKSVTDICGSMLFIFFMLYAGIVLLSYIFVIHDNCR